jgi:hypothetical protein
MTINDQITQEIQKLVKDWTRANRHQPEIARLDRDILFDNLRLLYDLIDELGAAHPGANVSNPKSIHVEETLKEIPVQIKKQDDYSVKEEIELKLKKEEDNSQNKKVVEEVAKKPFPEPAVEETHEVLLPLVPTKKPSKSTADQFAPAKTFADVYQKSDDTSLAAHIGSYAIPDIRTAIGVNDKFLFINEVFKGDVEAYQQTIDRLNRQTLLNDALQVIDEVKQKYAIQDKEAIDTLIKIIKRKFQN